MVFAEGDDARRDLGNLAVRDDFVAVEAGGPDAARFPVAADVGALQFREPLAAVDVAAGDAGRLGVREGEIRRQDRRRAALAFGMNRLRAFDDAPAVVAALLDPVDHLPQFPADIADPQVAGLRSKLIRQGLRKP